MTPKHTGPNDEDWARWFASDEYRKQIQGDSMIDYRNAFQHFVKTKLPAFYEGLKPFYAARGASDDSLSYFREHWPRFEAMVKLCLHHGLDAGKVNTIADIGAWYPYASYYWKLTDPDCTIDLYDIVVRELKGQVAEYDVDGVRLIDHNLCTDALPNRQYDLVIASEVLEHLPCNIFHVCADIQAVVKPGGHLLVTFPLGRKNPKGYGDNLKQYDHTRLVEPHVREFTPETVPLFFKDMTKLGATKVRYQHGKMVICLYQR